MKTTLLVAGASILVAVGLLVACGSEARPGASTSFLDGGGATDDADASRADGGENDAATDASPHCPELAPGAGVVQATYLGGTPPDDTGGTLVPGTYDLTKLEIYLGTPEQGDPDSGPAGGMTDSAQATFELTASTLLLAKSSTTLGVPSPLAVTLSNVSTESVVELVTTQTCPGSAEQKTPFTASGTTISMHTAQTRREIYTRR